MISPVTRLGAALALSAALTAFGYVQGLRATDARHTAAVVQLKANLSEHSARANRAALAFLQLEAASHARDKELEDEARKDPDADRPALSRDSVRRVFSR